VLVPVIPILIAITWLAVVMATIGACRVAARADAAEVEMYGEARRRKTLRVRGGGGLGRGCSAVPDCWLPCAARYPRRAGSGLAGEPLHRARRDVRCPGRVRTSGCRRQFMQTERAGRSMTTAREPLGLRAGAHRCPADRLTHHGATTLAGRAGQSPLMRPGGSRTPRTRASRRTSETTSFGSQTASAWQISDTVSTCVQAARHVRAQDASGRSWSRLQKSAQFWYADVRSPGKRSRARRLLAERTGNVLVYHCVRNGRA
jgi:hypothetical protein